MLARPTGTEKRPFSHNEEVSGFDQLSNKPTLFEKKLGGVQKGGVYLRKFLKRDRQNECFSMNDCGIKANQKQAFADTTFTLLIFKLREPCAGIDPQLVMSFTNRMLDIDAFDSPGNKEVFTVSL